MEHDRLTQAPDRIAAAVSDVASSEQWQSMLTVAARFHRYSANNVWLILAQRASATRVAGYRAWQQMGRQVGRGERGIAILAPCVRSFETDGTNRRGS